MFDNMFDNPVKYKITLGVSTSGGFKQVHERPKRRPLFPDEEREAATNRWVWSVVEDGNPFTVWHRGRYLRFQTKGGAERAAKDYERTRGNWQGRGPVSVEAEQVSRVTFNRWFPPPLAKRWCTYCQAKGVCTVKAHKFEWSRV